MKHSKPFLRLAALLLPFLSLCAAMAAPSAADAPVFLTHGLVYEWVATSPSQFATFLIHPSGRRAYFYKPDSNDPLMRNLVVVPLDASGTINGQAKFYADSTQPFPAAGYARYADITADFTKGKLYIARNVLNASAGYDTGRELEVFNLDKNGDPVGPPRNYETGNQYRTWSLALNPVKHKLYATLRKVDGTGEIATYSLDETGEPQPKPVKVPVGYPIIFLKVNVGGTRLYGLSHSGYLYVLALKPDGTPDPESAKVFSIGPNHQFPTGSTGELQRYLLTKDAIYFIQREDNKGYVARWALDGDGYPTGDPELLKNAPGEFVALTHDGHSLWTGHDTAFHDAFLDKDVRDGMVAQRYALGADGRAGALQEEIKRPRESSFLGVTSGNRPFFFNITQGNGVLGNRTKDWRMRFILQSAVNTKGENIPELAANLQFADEGKWRGFKPGVPSEWQDLNPWLKGRTGPLSFHFASANAVTTAVAKWKMTVEIERPEEDPKTVTMTDEVVGDSMWFLLPGYADPKENWPFYTMPLSEYSKYYLEKAKEIAIDPKDRPKQFIVSCGQNYVGQGNLKQLQNQAEAVSLMGFNTVFQDSYTPGISIPNADAVLDKFGLKQRSIAISIDPPFDYLPYIADRAQLEKDTRKIIASNFKVDEPTARDKARVVQLKMLDEPGWYFPKTANDVRDNPVYLARFRDYLKKNFFKPADFGAASWNAVLPIGFSAVKDLPTRKLFFWQMRFFSESAADGLKATRETFEKVLGHPIYADSNWNNWNSVWYRPTPNQENKPGASSDSGTGSFDWFNVGRKSAFTLWTEDWIDDTQSETWSLRGDALRSAAMEGKSEFGGYIVALATGQIPDGASYRLLSLIGHGAKVAEFYCYGNAFVFTGNGWSQSFHAYKDIANANARLGRAERLLYPGKPSRGKVAIMMPSISLIWQSTGLMPYFVREHAGLHAALIHAGYTVDFVDETALENNSFAARGYSVLYLTGPNLAEKAQHNVANWTSAGGTLVALPGAAIADEYDTPLKGLDTVLGLKGRKASREAAPNSNRDIGLGPKLAASDSRFAVGAKPEDGQLRGPFQPLQKTTAAVLASTTKGEAAVTANVWGKGRAISYGFYPGLQYELSAFVLSSFPQNWDAKWRNLAVQPAVIARTSKPVVVSEPGIESCRLESAKGIAVVLLNWVGQPFEKITVTIPHCGKFAKVTSNEGTPVQTKVIGDGVQVTMALKSVDVLMVE